MVERKNRHLLDITRCLLFHMHVLKHFGSDVLIACYLINRMPSSVLDGGSTLSFIFFFVLVLLITIDGFGCIFYVHNLGPGYDNLDPCATKCVFVGYSTTLKGYHC